MRDVDEGRQRDLPHLELVHGGSHPVRLVGGGVVVELARRHRVQKLPPQLLVLRQLRLDRKERKDERTNDTRQDRGGRWKKMWRARRGELGGRPRKARTPAPGSAGRVANTDDATTPRGD